MNISSRLRRFVLVLSLAAVAGLSSPAVYGNPADQRVVHLVAIGDLDVGKEIKKDGSIKYADFGIKVAEDGVKQALAWQIAVVER